MTDALTVDQLEALCGEWQRRLRITDWRIGVKLAHWYEMDHGENVGMCEIWSPHKRALVRIIHESEYESVVPLAIWPYDPELILVHELLHIVMEAFTVDAKSPEFVEFERAINLISGALVSAKQGVEDKGREDLERGGEGSTEAEVKGGEDGDEDRRVEHHDYAARAGRES